MVKIATKRAWAKRNKLRAEGNKLCAEGNKLRAEGDIIFLTAVSAEYGNVEIEWTFSGCELDNGVVFKNK